MPDSAQVRKKSGRLVSEIRLVKNVNSVEREAMWALYDAYYAEAERETFDRDFSNKSHVIVLRDDGDDSIQGFSTIQCYPDEVEGKRFFCIYSGDTIVAKEYWGQNTLQKAFLRYIVRCKLSHPFRPVYWFLISKGYKTYLLLSRNFPVYWPRHDKALPKWEKCVLDTLGRERFGSDYRADSGLVRHDICLGRLRENVAPISNDLKEKHPDIKFFDKINPNHVQGDELCCLGLVSPVQWIFYLGRLGRKKTKRVLQPIWERTSKKLLPEQSFRP